MSISNQLMWNDRSVTKSGERSNIPRASEGHLNSEGCKLGQFWSTFNFRPYNIGM